MNPAIIYIILGVLVLGFAALFYFILELKKQSQKPQDDQSLKVMMEWMKDIKLGSDSSRKEIQDSIQKGNDDLNKRLTDAARLFSEVQHKVGEMTEVGRGMKEIQEMLRGSKLRGGMGETSLEMTLKQILSNNNYQLQYRFNSGETVDCVIKMGKELLSVDSKFPLENFRLLIKAESEEDQTKFRKDFFKDVKKHIDSISKKYILPNENTMDFAMMFLPLESLFQEIINDPETSEYARMKRIYITSHNSFYHFLTIINNGLRGTQINEMIKPLIRTIAALKQDSDKFIGSLSTLTKHITNAKNSSDLINEDFRKLASKIESAHGLQIESEIKSETTIESQKLIE